MNVYARLVYRNLRANLDRITVFFELIFPLFFIFIQGFGLGGIIPDFKVGNAILTYPQYLAAGAVTLTVINSGTNAGTQLWYDRKNGMFEQILMGPFTRAQYILSIILATLILGVVASSLVFLIAFPVLGTGLSVTPFGVLLIAVSVFLGTVFFGTFAIAISVALRSSETFQIVSTFAFFVFLFVSSVFYPASDAPGPIQLATFLNPLTYTTDVFRAGLFGGLTPFNFLELGVLAAESAAMFALSVYAFRRIRV
ncbi:MAG TPA: ABC transporter permease [Nitrososphaerales archaeon]|nr:ABC transporter permease [Nitrososphaerales archaeon]